MFSIQLMVPKMELVYKDWWIWTDRQRCRLRSFFKSCAHIGYTSQLKTLRFFLQILYELCVTYFYSQIGDGW